MRQLVPCGNPICRATAHSTSGRSHVGMQRALDGYGTCGATQAHEGPKSDHHNHTGDSLQPDRFHTSSIGPDEQALHAALLKCRALMEHRACSTMGLAVHSKNSLDGVVRNVFGDSVIRVFDRDNKLELRGVTTHLLTEKIRVRRLEGSVLAAFVNPEKLDKIALCDGVTDIVFVPWTAEELAAYLGAYPSSEKIVCSSPA